MKYCEKDFQIEDGILRRYLGCDEDVVIPDCVHIIGEWAFQGCDTMKTLTIGESVREIGDRAFEYCTRLQKVIMSDNVVKMDWNAFAHCRALEVIRISDGITELDERGFLFVEKLKEIHYKGRLPFVEAYLLLGKQYAVNTSLLHWMLLHPSCFHPYDIEHAISYLDYCFPAFMQGITEPELQFLMQKGLVTAKNGEAWMTALRKNNNVECLNALILYLSENRIFAEDRARFELRL